MNNSNVFVIVLQAESAGKALVHSVSHNITMNDFIIKLKTIHETEKEYHLDHHN